MGPKNLQPDTRVCSKTSALFRPVEFQWARRISDLWHSCMFEDFFAFTNFRARVTDNSDTVHTNSNLLFHRGQSNRTSEYPKCTLHSMYALKSQWCFKVSCVNSIPEIFSKWIDHHLKTLVDWNLLPTYMKDSEQLQQSLSQAFPNGLQPNAQLFSVDAVSMYSNIDTAHGLE